MIRSNEQYAEGEYHGMVATGKPGPGTALGQSRAQKKIYEAQAGPLLE